MRRADASGASFAVIIGEDEVAKGVAQVKELRGTGAEGTGGAQETVPAEALVEHVIDRMVNAIESDDDEDDEQ